MILYRGDGGTPTSFAIGGHRYSTDSRTGLQRRGYLSRPRRLTMSWPFFAATPVYNKEDNLPVRTGLQRHGRFICLCRLRCCGRLYRPSPAAWSTSTHRAAPVCMSCLLSMSKSLLGKPGFLPTNWRQIIMYYQPPSALDGSMGRRTSRRHYSLVNFKSPVGRNHWPSC